jgi:hypothetical protein
VSAVEISLDAGTTHVFSDFPGSGHSSVTIHPGPGATVYVSLVTSLPSKVKAGTFRCSVAGVGEPGLTPGGQPAGVVTAHTGLVLDAPVTALRFETVGGTAVIEVVQ